MAGEVGSRNRRRAGVAKIDPLPVLRQRGLRTLIWSADQTGDRSSGINCGLSRLNRMNAITASRQLCVQWDNGRYRTRVG